MLLFAFARGPKFIVCARVTVADLEIEKGGGFKFWAATPTSGHAGGPNSSLVKCLEISKELIRECVTMPAWLLLLHATPA